MVKTGGHKPPFFIFVKKEQFMSVRSLKNIYKLKIL